MGLSDHGFDDFRGNCNINSWLRDNGYARSRNPSDLKTVFNFAFARCRAYALGVNGLYINLRGREAQGMVDGRLNAIERAPVGKTVRCNVDNAHDARPVHR